MFRVSSRLTTTALVAVAVILTTAATLVCITSRASDFRGPISRVPSPLLLQKREPAVAARQLVRVWVHANDLYPNVVHVQPGNLLLVAENETQGDVSLVVERVLGGTRAPVASLRTLQRGKRVRQELGVGIGEYVFYSEANPTLQGRLIVEPPGNQ